jgi:predicted lactoylglutathione lyase
MMSPKQVWINLPVKDINRSKEFFKSIGFTPNPMFENSPKIGSFFIGENNFVMMLFSETEFESIAQKKVSNTDKGSEILINLDAQSKTEVDDFSEVVKNAGGEIFSEPADADGWMYAFGFIDPDGHRWSMLYMDTSKMPSA